MSGTALPNILFILADDLGAWALGCAGNPEVRTPNLDRLASRGLRFSNAFCVSPVCSPARASLLTGRIPSHHGVHDWIRRGNSPGESADGALIDYLAQETTYTEILAARGYTVGLSGKWHLGDALRPQKGHTFWHTHTRGASAYYGAPLAHDGLEYTEPRYVTEVITDHALEFLQAGGAGAPFYLGVHYTAPHSPWDRAEHPPEFFDPYYENCPFLSAPECPPHPLQIDSAPVGDTPARRRELLSGYYAAITAMDHGIGRLLDHLEATGQLESTLIVFSGDNGMNMGHHGIWGKGNGTYPQNFYDTSVKVPFLLSWPGRIPQGAVADRLFSHYDFMPSLLGLLGFESDLPAGLPGSDLSALWQGRGESDDAEIIIFDEYGSNHMIRTRDWKYIHRYSGGPGELYALISDPGEEVNRIADPSCREILETLQERLHAWFARHARPAMDGRSLPVTGKGQLDRLDSGTVPAFNQDFRYRKMPG